MTRLPDFIIVGAMKSGTTSLYRWLSEQPELALPADKEPEFFATDELWARGVDWYGTVFADAPDAKLTGEASVTYTDPAVADKTAERMAATVPAAKLIYVLRQPIDRLRSHYRHEVQRGRERRTFAAALQADASPYVRRSMYYSCIAPYLERFPRRSLCIVRFEDLIGTGSPAWDTVLDHLDLPSRPAPGTAHNVTAEKDQFTGLMRRLWESGWLTRLRRAPRPLRRLGKRLLTRRGGRYARLLSDSEGPVPAEPAAEIWEDIARLEEWLGHSLWTRSAATR